jgi:hypothetical protein
LKFTLSSLSRTLVGLLALCLSASASAYIGPGSGLGALGVLVGVVGAVVLAIISFLWYPLKRLLGANKQEQESEEEEEEVSSESPHDTPSS